MTSLALEELEPSGGCRLVLVPTTSDKPASCKAVAILERFYRRKRHPHRLPEDRGPHRADAEPIATRPGSRYDNGMTAAKIAITLPADQLERVRRAVKRGRADSVSAYIAQALERQDREETLADLLRDLVALHGEPSRKEKAWARRVLRRRSRG